MYGGGAVVTLAILAALLLHVITTVQNYVDREQQDLAVDLRHINHEMTEAEAVLRNQALNAEMLWKSAPVESSELSERFVTDDNVIIIRQSPPILIVGTRSAAIDSDTLARYLVLARQMALHVDIVSARRGAPVTSYLLSPDHTLAIVSLGVELSPAEQAAVLKNRDELFKSLTSGVDRTADTSLAVAPSMTGVRRVWWLPTEVSPFLGSSAIRLVTLARTDRGQLFGELVVEIPLPLVTASLPTDRFSGTFLVTTSEGHLVTATRREGVDRHTVSRLMAEQWAENPPNQGDVTYFGGMLVLREQFGRTGWYLTYASTQESIFGDLRTPIITAVVTSTLIIALIWLLLLIFDRRVFKPMIERSHRVFDSERLNRTLVEMAPVGLALIERESGTPLLRSPIMADVAASVITPSGSLSAEFVSRHRQSASMQSSMKPRESDSVTDETVTLAKRDGGEVSLAVRYYDGRYQGANVVVTAFTDVTTERELKRALQQATLSAEAASAAKSAFLAATSHEVRTPLNAILGNLELLERTQLTSIQRDRLDTVQSACKGLASLINDILDYSKVEAGEMHYEQQEFDVADLAGSTLNLLAPIAHAKGLILFYALDADVPRAQIGDSARLGQVLRNLLVNAIKFTPNGSVTLQVSIERDSHLSGATQVVLIVEDTGIGVPEHQRSRLFEAFEQGDPTVSQRFGGTGLGLALCKRLVEGVGGTIEYAGTQTTGSRFEVRLPSRPVHKTPPESVPPFFGQSVLFVAGRPEWHRHVLPHLFNWGLRPQTLFGPAEISDAMLQAANTVILFGDRDDWSADEEDRLLEFEVNLIIASPDGPAQPVRSGRLIAVSTYTLSGLCDALRSTLLDRSLDPSTVAFPAAQLHPLQLSVLVVEDNPVNRYLVADQLELLGCEVIVTDNGQSALQAFDETAFDVVLTDLDMPGMNGHQLAREIRNRGALLPMVAITAHVSTKTHAQAIDSGMTRVITKPVSISVLHEVLCSFALHHNEAVSYPPRVLSGNVKARPDDVQAMFLASFKADLELLVNAYEACDISAMHRSAHSLKGSLGACKLPDLAILCTKIEVCLTQGDLAGAGTFLASLRTSIERLSVGQAL